jgi:molybdopterin converting factor small subunit
VVRGEKIQSTDHEVHFVGGVVDRGNQITFVMMQVKVFFFGNLTEAVQADRLIWPLDADVLTVENLRLQLEETYPVLLGKTYRVAVNQRFVEEGFVLNSGDEVAMMPPFSGG